jgi:hypothetical protein
MDVGRAAIFHRGKSMRMISGLLLGLGLALWTPLASAQEPIAIQVTIGADGAINVIDAKTGKVLARVAGQKGQAAPDAQKQLEHARHQLEEMLRK